MKRVFWTVGVCLAGCFVGGMAGGRVGVVVGLIWGASIGFGFGTIFTQKRPHKGLVLWWVSTLALVAPPFGVLIEALPRPYVTRVQMMVAGAAGAVAGALLGLAIGALQLKRMRRTSEALRSGPVA
jgi:hypothetical protein